MCPHGKPSGVVANTSATRPVTAMPLIGVMPELTPLANVTTSGFTSQWSTANQAPVRPNAVTVSSQIISTPYRSQSSRTPSR